MQPPPPGAPAGAQPWQVDLDWLWGTPPGNDGSPATLRLDVVGPGAARATTRSCCSPRRVKTWRTGWRTPPTTPMRRWPPSGASPCGGLPAP